MEHNQTPTTDRHWRWWAQCSDEDPNLFSSKEADDGPNWLLRRRTAEAICAECPVMAECYDEAASWGDAYGIFGGQLFIDGKVNGRPVGTALQGSYASRRRAARVAEAVALAERKVTRPEIARRLEVSQHWVDQVLAEQNADAA